MRHAQKYPDLKAAVTSTLAAIARFDVSAVDILTVDLSNAGVALNAFQVRSRGALHPTRPHQIYKSTWSSADGRVIDFITAPDTLADGANAQMQINVSGLESIELWASCASATVITASAAGYAE